MAEPKNKSTVLVALPAEDEHVHDLGPEQKHATLLFFGEISDFDAGWVNAAVMALAYDPKLMPSSPFRIYAGEVGDLGEDDPPARVLHLRDDDGPDGVTLGGIRQELLADENVKRLFDAIDQYPNYTPHVTLGYGDEVGPSDVDAAEQLGSIRFNRLALWHKDKQLEYPLDGRDVALTSAGHRIVRTQEGAKRFGVPIGSEITVDDKGKVVRITKARVTDGSGGPKGPKPPSSGSSGGALAHVKPPRPDPDRKPHKFVATRPGQKAKLATSSAGGTSNGMTQTTRTALTDFTKIRETIGSVTASQREALIDVMQHRPISSGDKAALRSMIEHIFRQLAKPDKEESDSGSDKKSESKSDKRSAAQEAATEKAQKASSKSTSSAKKEAQAKAQKAATAQSAWIRSLKAAYAALGGDPKDLPSVGGKSAGSAASSSKAASKSDGGSSRAVDDRPVPQQGFTGMDDKELASAIRRLAMEKRSNPSSVVLTALRKARTVRDRRALLRRDQEKRRREFLDKAGA